MSAVVTITISIVVNDGAVAVHAQTADGNPPGESSRHDRRPDGPGSSFADRLKAESERSASGCLEWTGPKDGSGYGRVYFGDKKDGAHRIAWTIMNGPIPKGMSVCHRCDNPACIDTEHMFLGTQAQNFADMFAKGRNAKGERTPQAKLSAPQVLEILSDKGSTKELSKRFGVSECCVRDIRSGRRWQHLNNISCGGGESRPAPEGSIFSRASITQTPSPGQTEGVAGCELESGGVATGANPSTVKPQEPAVQQKADDGGAWMQAGVASGPQDPSRSPAVTTSDSTEPVEPTGNEGLAGERDLNALLASAKTTVDALSTAERDAMLKAQAASFARAEMAFGSDEQEASDRARHTDDGLDIPVFLRRRQKASA